MKTIIKMKKEEYPKVFFRKKFIFIPYYRNKTIFISFGLLKDFNLK